MRSQPGGGNRSVAHLCSSPRTKRRNGERMGLDRRESCSCNRLLKMPYQSSRTEANLKPKMGVGGGGLGGAINVPAGPNYQARTSPSPSLRLFVRRALSVSLCYGKYEPLGGSLLGIATPFHERAIAAGSFAKVGLRGCLFAAPCSAKVLYWWLLGVVAVEWGSALPVVPPLPLGPRSSLRRPSLRA